MGSEVTAVALRCDMHADCTGEVSHIDNSGFVYCATHGVARRQSGRLCRKLRPHELNVLRRGETIARY